MTRKKDRIAMEKFVAMKRITTRARLEANIRTTRALNEILAEFADAYDAQVTTGQPFKLADYEEWLVERLDAWLPPAVVDGES